jgi:putative NADH-flavin reductase
MRELAVGVIGPAGFGGSYLCVELLNRGHNVRGMSRNPSRLGIHPKYAPKSIDLDAAKIEELAEVFKGLDVLINEYGPHTSGENALVYRKPATLLSSSPKFH